ncbi:MAG: ThiF family adenylyltransferase [Actinomycetota bacterium]|nr:ThiF family adenylyltransferase [Actinomycetota bacterium]
MTARIPEASTSGPEAAIIRLTDGLVNAIIDRLAAVHPERGGAILSCGDLLHLLVEDTSGRYSEASWDISAELSAEVGALEAAGRGILAGTVHTHPAGVPDPSDTDIGTTRQALDLNPHLDRLLIAVVTEGEPRRDDLPVGERHRMSLHLLRRTASGEPALTCSRGEIVALEAGLSAAGVTMESSIGLPPQGRRRARSKTRGPSLPGVIRVNRRPMLAVAVPSGRPAALFIDPGYPQAGPIAVTAGPGGGAADLRPLPSPWDPVSPPGPQLAALARAAAGLHIPGATDRAWPLTGPLVDARVVVAGAGSVGSRIAEDLVRSGVGALAIIDPDLVEAANLSRTVYAAADIGLPKPQALAGRLRAIDPAVTIESHLSPLGLADLSRILDGVSLVVAATDDMAEQAVLAHHAYAAGVPLVACAVYKAAAAGEVVITVPTAKTACWSCAVGAGSPADQHRPERDYGLGGRLAGEAALGPSIHQVTSVATTAALGLLAGPDAPAGAHLTRLLAEGRTLGLVATTPDWDFFQQVFTGMDHQHAPQSVWVRVSRSSSCPVCGDQPIPPLTPQAAVQLIDAMSRLREQIKHEQAEATPCATTAPNRTAARPEQEPAQTSADQSVSRRSG